MLPDYLTAPSRDNDHTTSLGGSVIDHPRNINLTSVPPSTCDASSSSHPSSLGIREPNVLDPPDILGDSSAAGSVDENDIIIAVMGLTGAGKSSFINMAAGKTVVEIGHNLDSQTRAVRPVRCFDPDGRRRIVLVDTPGFDDTHLSDTQVLRIISHWLNKTYRNGVKLSGILYLHRIADNRMAGAPLRNISVFRDLCGDSNFKNIILVTTMWDEVDDQSVGPQREEELVSNFWQDMIRQGSLCCRFRGTCASAWRIIDSLDLDGHRAPLQIQYEMVDRGQQFHETTAAKTLLRFLVQLGTDFMKGVKGLAKLRFRRGRKAGAKASGVVPPEPVLHRSSTIRSNVSRGSWSVVSQPSTMPTSPAGSPPSRCTANSHRGVLSAMIEALKLSRQMADIGHIPILRGIIGTVLHMAQLIEDIGGTHHAIIQVVESSGWLLTGITRCSIGPKLSKDTKKTLTSLQRALKNFQQVVSNISGRDQSARFLLLDADIEAIKACTTSIRAVHNKLEAKFTIENSYAVLQLEEQVIALGQSAALRQCECGIFSKFPPGHEGQETGQPASSTSQ